MRAARDVVVSGGVVKRGLGLRGVIEELSPSFEPIGSSGSTWSQPTTGNPRFRPFSRAVSRVHSRVTPNNTSRDI